MYHTCQVLPTYNGEFVHLIVENKKTFDTTMTCVSCCAFYVAMMYTLDSSYMKWWSENLETGAVFNDVTT